MQSLDEDEWRRADIEKKKISTCRKSKKRRANMFEQNGHLKHQSERRDDCCCLASARR